MGHLAGHARAPAYSVMHRNGGELMVGRIGLNALLLVIWMAAMWAIGPERIIGFQHISVLMALATSAVMIATAIGVNSAWSRRFG